MRVFFIYLVLIFSISVKADEREHLLVSIDSVFIESVNWHILPDPPATCMTFEECSGNKGKMIYVKLTTKAVSYTHLTLPTT